MASAPVAPVFEILEPMQIEAFAAAERDMAETLRLVILMAENTDAQRRLDAADERIAVEVAPYVWLATGKSLPAEFLRSKPAMRVVQLREIARAVSVSPTSRVTAEAWKSIRLRAETIVKSLVGTQRMPNRQDIQLVMSWAPALEYASFRFGMVVSILLDLLRRRLQPIGGSDPELRAAVLKQCWNYATVSARLGLMAAHGGTQPWMRPMLEALELRQWTPTVGLLRHRSLYLAGVAGRVAAAFGETALDRYADALDASRHPVHAFDALFGLAAVGASRPDMVDACRRIIRGSRSLSHCAVEFRPFFERAFASAEHVLAADPSAKAPKVLRDLSLGAGHGLSAKGFLTVDPMTASNSGIYLGIELLRTFLQAPEPEYFPIHRAAILQPPMWLKDREYVRLIENASTGEMLH